MFHQRKHWYHKHTYINTCDQYICLELKQRDVLEFSVHLNTQIL